MNNLFKFLFKGIALIITIFAFNFSFGQTSVTVNFNATGLTAGDTIDVPVVFNSTVNVGLFQILFYFDKDVLTVAKDTCTFDPIWKSLGATPGKAPYFPLTNSGSQYFGKTAEKISWLSSGVSAACSNRTAFTLHFVYHGGTTNIQIIDTIITTTSTPNYKTIMRTSDTISHNNLSVLWYGGSASGSKVPYTSKAIGGSWANPATWILGAVPTSSNATEVIIASTPSNPTILDTNITTTFNVTLNAGSALTINSNKTFNVGGNFLIKSDISGTGSLIQNGTLNATTSKVQKYIYGNEWHIMSIPITSSTASIFDAANNNGDSIYVKYLVNNTWNWIYSVSTALSPYQGYFLWADTIYFHHPSPTLNFTGTINSANQTISTIGGSNWQMIGNSYTSAIDWSTVSSRTNAAGSAYYCWSPTVGAGTYATSDGSINVNGATKYIPAMQGFFIKSLNTNGISLTSANKVHNTQSFFKSSNDINDLIRLTASIGSRFDETVIAFDQNSTNNYDIANDVTKLMANDSVVPEIYTIASAEDLVINRFGTYPYAVPFNVNLLKNVDNNIITITASDFSNFDSGASIILEDVLLNTTQDLRLNPVYNFTASLGNNSGRFILHFANPTYGVNELTKKNVSIYSYDKDVYINTNDNVKEISIYNIMGQEILKKSEPNKQTLYKLTVDNATGNYIVKVLTDKGVYTEKVFIK